MVVLVVWAVGSQTRLYRIPLDLPGLEFQLAFVHSSLASLFLCFWRALFLPFILFSSNNLQLVLGVVGVHRYTNKRSEAWGAHFPFQSGV